MFVLALLIGITLPALTGWLALDLLEWNTPVLWRCEKWVMGFALGTTLSMFAAFLANILLGFSFTLPGFLETYCILIAVLGAPWLLRRQGRNLLPAAPGPAPSKPLSLAEKIVLGALGGWVLVRVVAFGILSFITPSFFDDTMSNWNMRGKMFYFDKTLSLVFPWDNNAQGVTSYPPTVPLMKTWLATLNGGWSEALANGIHTLWFVALLLLVYWSLRRLLPRGWSLLGTILLASLPLELIQGTGAYADVFLSLHLVVAVSLLLHALRSHHRASAASFLRLAAFAIALVPFTKNEGWALYFPVLVLLTCAVIPWLWRKRVLDLCSVLQTVIPGALLVCAITGIWIAFKLMHGLSFGNAKGIDFKISFQHGVALSIVVNTFLEGNWGLLFVLFFGLLGLRWKTAFRSPLLLLSAFFLIPYVGQLFVYLFTGLGQEALFQTGYARGLIQMMPVIVMLTTLLLHDTLYGKPASGPASV